MSIPVSSSTRAAHLRNFPKITSQPLGLGSLINLVSQTHGNVVMSGSINPEPRILGVIWECFRGNNYCGRS